MKPPCANYYIRFKAVESQTLRESNHSKLPETKLPETSGSFAQLAVKSRFISCCWWSHVVAHLTTLLYPCHRLPPPPNNVMHCYQVIRLWLVLIWSCGFILSYDCRTYILWTLVCHMRLIRSEVVASYYSMQLYSTSGNIFCWRWSAIFVLIRSCLD